MDKKPLIITESNIGEFIVVCPHCRNKFIRLLGGKKDKSATESCRWCGKPVNINKCIIEWSEE